MKSSCQSQFILALMLILIDMILQMIIIGHTNMFKLIHIFPFVTPWQVLSRYRKGWRKLLCSIYFNDQNNLPKLQRTLFGTRKYKGKTVFKYNRNVIDVVDELKYLGILFKHNGNFKSCRKYLYAQAQKAMFSLMCKCRRFKLPPSTCVHLFW